jgi:hypothetical protein
MEPQSAATPVSASDGGASATGPPRRNYANPPAADVPWADWPDEELADAREQPFVGQFLLNKQAAKGFREVYDVGPGTARVAKSTPQKREVHEEAPEDLLTEEPAAFLDELEPLEPHELDAPEERDLDPVYDPEEELPLVVRPMQTLAIAPADKYERSRLPLPYGVLARLSVVLIILVGVVATVSWQWSAIKEFYQLLTHTESKPRGVSNHNTPSAQSKFFVSLPQERDIARGTVSLGAQTAATVAQRVVLHEEDRNDQQHRQYMGSAIWRTVPVSPGVAPELAVVARAEIPERRMTVAWSLRRNIDNSLPASHTIEIKFNLPADFPDGGIANVSGILMAEAEQTRGTPLAGLAVKITDGFFVIGLSEIDPHVQRNKQLLKGRPWFYIPIMYTNGGRAILAMEKGPSGDRALAEAFASWEKRYSTDDDAAARQSPRQTRPGRQDRSE